VTAEEAIIAIAEPLLATVDATATISVGVPTDWDATKPPHVQVAQDSPLRNVASGGAFWATIRLTVYAADTYTAQTIAKDLWDALADHDGTPPVSIVLPGLGPLPVHDPDSGWDLATLAVPARFRSL